MTLEGVTFDGYRLVRLLGRGGAGEVYLAETPAYGPGSDLGVEQVAIKVFRDARGEEVAHGLLQEAQAVAALNLPNILPCFGDTAQGNDLALVMAYAPGGSLGAVANLPLRLPVVALIVSQVTSVLADLHKRGLTHGDLKPNNLFARTAPGGGTIVALSDFGQGFLPRAAVATIRQDQSGQPPAWAVEQLAWAAPEQLRGDAVPASDQYSLAALAYHLLTGIWPVSAEAQAILNGSRAPQPIAPPSRLNPALDDEVDATLFYALSPRPEHRFEDVREFAQALEDALTPGRSTSAMRKLAPPGASPESRPAKRTLGQMSYPVVVNDDDLERNRVREWDDWDDGDADEDNIAAAAAGAAGRQRASRGWRGLVVTTLLLALALVVGTLGVLAFNPSLRPFKLPLNLPALTASPTPESTPTPPSSAQSQAESQYHTALAHPPAYSDALTGKPATWATSGKVVFFGPDQRLHLYNTAKAPLFEDMPASVAIPSTAYVATVDVALVRGATSGHAGLRFLVSKSSKGDTYYSYLITPDARFELWAQQPDTGLIFQTSGYVASLKTGMGQVNTLAVLVDPAHKTLTLFANGAFVFQTPIATGVALNGRLGVLTPDTGVEATFSKFAVYSV